MPNLMPDAVWRPIPVATTRPRRRKGRGVCLHVAVSEAPSLYGFFSTAEVDSHLYVNRAGVVEQYVDLDLVAYANRDGNPTLISVETQGGVANADGEPWTPAQVEALARIAKWAHDTEGVPLQVMPDSLPASRGIGWHRLGCRPGIVAGGEVWSSAYGKICPGAAKIAQVPVVVERARVLAGQVPPAPVKPPTTSTSRPTILRGSTGQAVRDLQARLAGSFPAYRHEHGQLRVDGEFGPTTEAWVREYQGRAGLTVDGIVGPRTWVALGLS